MSASPRWPALAREGGKAPGQLHAADVDLYLSDKGAPYWPDAEQVRRDNSAMGPLTKRGRPDTQSVSTYQRSMNFHAGEEAGVCLVLVCAVVRWALLVFCVVVRHQPGSRAAIVAGEPTTLPACR